MLSGTRSFGIVGASALAFLLSGCISDPVMSEAEAREKYLDLSCPASTASLQVTAGILDGRLDRVTHKAAVASSRYKDLAVSLRETAGWPEEIKFDLSRVADDLDDNVIPTMDALALARNMETVDSVLNDGSLAARGRESGRVLHYLGLDALALECVVG